MDIEVVPETVNLTIYRGDDVDVRQLAKFKKVERKLLTCCVVWIIMIFNKLNKGPVAQGLEQGTHNPLVVGSKPTGPTKFKKDERKLLTCCTV